jgi:hypothetical protein
MITAMQSFQEAERVEAKEVLRAYIVEQLQTVPVMFHKQLQQTQEWLSVAEPWTTAKEFRRQMSSKSRMNHR